MTIRRLPPLNASKAFEAAARHGSFTRASAELCVAHGAVSRQIRAVEEWLGVKLFVRTVATRFRPKQALRCSTKPARRSTGWQPRPNACASGVFPMRPAFWNDPAAGFARGHAHHLGASAAIRSISIG
jgi:hypothetical protein